MLSDLGFEAPQEVSSGRTHGLWSEYAAVMDSRV